MGAAAEHLGADDRREIASRLLREPRWHGGEVWAHCPWHAERTPGNAFSYNPQPDVAYCNSCGERGDIIDLYAAVHDLDKSEAFKEFMREFCPGASVGGGPSRRGRTPRMPQEYDSPTAWVPEEPASPSEKWRSKCGRVMTWGCEQLQEDRSVQRWLLDRGISPQTAIQFGLGWIPKSYYRERRSWGIAPEYHSNGKEKKLWIPRGLVIPYLRHGQLQRLRFRRFENDEMPKYYALPGSSKAPMWICRRGESSGPQAVIVIEAELDGIMAYEQAGDLVHVAALGSSSAKPHDPELLRILDNASCILLALDFDQAGQKALRWWRERYATATYWPVPEGKDPGDAYKTGVDIREWILEGLPPAFRVHAERRAELQERERTRDAARTDGPLPTGSQNKGAGDESESTPPRASQERAPSSPRDTVQEAIQLLRLLDARVTMDEDGGMSLAQNPKRAHKHWEDSRRLSALLFGDSDVGGILDAMGPGKWSARDLERML